MIYNIIILYTLYTVCVFVILTLILCCYDKWNDEAHPKTTQPGHLVGQG